MPKPLPPLESLRVLAACVQLGTFTRAAAELRITPTAVSQRMRALEVQLGVALFLRHGPKLTATDHARALGQRISDALNMIRVAVEDCRNTKNPLRVTCPPTFAARWLAPRLGSYHKLPGATPISLDPSQALAPQGTFDVGIRLGRGPWPGYQSVRLMSERCVPMLSPKWVRPGTRMTAKKLLQIPLIPDPRWSAWFSLAGVKNASPKFVATRYRDYELEAAAAVDGIGAAMLPIELFETLVTQGILVAPFGIAVDGPASFWLLWTKESSDAHFLAWMRSQFGAT